MSTHDDPNDPSVAELDVLRERIVYLQEALGAISRGGVDAVIFGEPEQEIYTLTSADRPYRVIVESMGEGAVTVSEGGVILFVNRQLTRFLGVDRTKMIGRDLTDYVSAEQRPLLAALLDGAEAGTRRGELLISRADGAEVTFLVAVTDLDIEGVLVRCLVLTDLTMQKQVEAQSAAEAALNQRHLVAREANDTIVQGLVAAETALDLGQVDFARDLIGRTSRQARQWIGNLAGDLSGNHRLEPGMAVRSTPAKPAREDE